MRHFVFAVSCLLQTAMPAIAAGKPEPVHIAGYAGEAMEPFLSRDGRVLFFNTRNDPGINTNIHFAAADGAGFVYRGILEGTVSSALDGTPTMSVDGRFCFISPREYRRTLVSVFCGTFDSKRVNNVQPQTTLPGQRLGRLIFDVELSVDGRSLLFAEGTFSGNDAPDESDIYLATLGAGGFVRSPASAKLFSHINTSALEYAPSLSANGLELYFTRLTGFWIFRQPRIFYARRPSLDAPFGEPVEMEPAEGFVEAPSLAADGTLYFHRLVDDRFAIWRRPR